MTITEAPTTDTGLSPEQSALDQLAQTAARAEQALIAAVSDWVNGRAPQGGIAEAHDALQVARARRSDPMGTTIDIPLPACPDQVPCALRTRSPTTPRARTTSPSPTTTGPS